ncbi:MAG: tetratricopeptide repeat protein [Candidatus Riflebacteria bacterium]|nr:tetratricopeptide repeat protein [Candidatus Riflebacteria bacterium]
MLYIKNKYLLYIIASSLLISLPSYSQNVFSPKKESAADSILNNTISNNPNSKTAKIICAKVYIKNGNYLEAEKLLMLVLEEDPNNTKANKLLKELNSLYKNTDNQTFETDYNLNNIPVPQVVDTKEEPAIIQEEKPVDNKSSILNDERIEKLISKNKDKKENVTVKLPTKEEILKRAKARKLAEKKEESQQTDNIDAPMAIQAPSKNHNRVNQVKEDNSSKEKDDYIEPIIIEPISENNTSENFSLPEKKTLIYR